MSRFVSLVSFFSDICIECFCESGVLFFRGWGGRWTFFVLGVGDGEIAEFVLL